MEISVPEDELYFDFGWRKLGGGFVNGPAPFLLYWDSLPFASLKDVGNGTLNNDFLSSGRGMLLYVTWSSTCKFA